MTAAAILIPWALLGFRDLGEYPHMLRLLVDNELSTSFSTTALAGMIGFTPAARVVQILCVIAIFALARRQEGDRRAFSAAVVAALALSPLVWIHYYLLLIVPIALSPPCRRSGWYRFLPRSSRTTFLRVACAVGVARHGCGCRVHAARSALFDPGSPGDSERGRPRTNSRRVTQTRRELETRVDVRFARAITRLRPALKVSGSSMPEPLDCPPNDFARFGPPTGDGDRVRTLKEQAEGWQRAVSGQLRRASVGFGCRMPTPPAHWPDRRTAPSRLRPQLNSTSLSRISRAARELGRMALSQTMSAKSLTDDQTVADRKSTSACLAGRNLGTAFAPRPATRQLQTCRDLDHPQIGRGTRRRSESA
jgi:hypothetical protein